MVTNLTDEELLDDLRSGPTGQKMLREREGRRLAERRAWAGEIEVLEAAHLKALPRLKAGEEAAFERVKEAQKALEAAQEGWRTAHVAHTNATVRFGTQRDTLEAKLRETAAPEIDAFLAELTSEWDRVRNNGLNVSPARRHRVTGELVGGYSNAESVKGVLEALNAGRVKAEDLKLRAFDREELAAELDAIRDEIPQVEA